MPVLKAEIIFENFYNFLSLNFKPVLFFAVPNDLFWCVNIILFIQYFLNYFNDCLSLIIFPILVALNLGKCILILQHPLNNWRHSLCADSELFGDICLFFILHDIFVCNGDNFFIFQLCSILNFSSQIWWCLLSVINLEDRFSFQSLCFVPVIEFLGKILDEDKLTINFNWIKAFKLWCLKYNLGSKPAELDSIFSKLLWAQHIVLQYYAWMLSCPFFWTE